MLQEDAALVEYLLEMKMWLKDTAFVGYSLETKVWQVDAALRERTKHTFMVKNAGLRLVTVQQTGDALVWTGDDCSKSPKLKQPHHVPSFHNTLHTCNKQLNTVNFATLSCSGD